MTNRHLLLIRDLRRFAYRTRHELISLFLVASSAVVSAQQLLGNEVSAGFRKAYNTAIFKKSLTPSRLEALNAAESVAINAPSLVADLAAIPRPDFTRIVLASVDRKIVFEHYAEQSLRQSTPLGYSMSKSLTSLAVGKATCMGHLSSLNLRGGEIAPGLKGTSWGDATIEQLLDMRSGSSLQEPARAGWQSEPVAFANRFIYVGSLNKSYFDLMRSHDEKAANPGQAFHYNNYDTIALGLLVEQASGKNFSDFFDETVWKAVGAEQDGAWLRNRDGQTATFAGFSASPPDWLRLGHYVLESMENNKDCFGQYLRKATTGTSRTWVPTRCYGHQIWNWCDDQAFFFLGYGGQYLIMNPQKKLVVYIHQLSHQNDAKLVAWYHKLKGALPN